MNILLAEDEVQLSQVYAAALRHQGHTVFQAYNGQEAVDFTGKQVFDVIILDIMMPIKTGLEALREIRGGGSNTHIIMLTAMGEIDDKVTGLDAGADEYLSKPISLKELLAHLRSLERRLGLFGEPILSYGDVRFRLQEQELSAVSSIRLSGKEARLMELFLRNPEKLLSTEEIYRQIWETDRNENEEEDMGYVYIYVSYLRQKLSAIRGSLTIMGNEDESYILKEIEGV